MRKLRPLCMCLSFAERLECVSPRDELRYRLAISTRPRASENDRDLYHVTSFRSAANSPNTMFVVLPCFSGMIGLRCGTAAPAILFSGW